MFYPLSIPGLTINPQAFSSENVRALLSYARLVLSYTLPYSTAAATTLPNGFTITPTFNSLSLLLSRLSSEHLNSLGLTILRLAASQPDHTVMDIFLIASLSTLPDISGFSTNWLKGKTPRYSSLEEIPLAERTAYDQMIQSLLDLCKETPGSFSTGLVKEGMYLLPPTVRCSVLEILARCYISERHNRQLLTILAANLANPQLTDTVSIQLTLATYQFVKKASLTVSKKTLSLLAKVIYMSMWKTLLLLHAAIKKLRQSTESASTSIPLLLKECLDTALGLLATLAQRIPEVLPLRCEEVRLCVKIIEEEAAVKVSRMHARQEPMTVEFFQCLCSLRHVFRFLPETSQEAILVGLHKIKFELIFPFFIALF